MRDPAISSSDYSPQMLPWSRPDRLNLALIVLGVVAAIWAFWQPGLSGNNDMLMGIYRVYELDRSWAAGLFYPRVGMGLNFTYSAPLFQYYAPLVSYGTLMFHWIGFGLVEATKAMFALTLLLAGSGAYTYARFLFANRRAALLSAIAYLFAPYLLCNIYQRGALAETLALSLLPWIAWTTHRLLDEGEKHWLWASAGLIALLIVAHNITALFALPVLAAYWGWLAWQKRAWRHLTSVGLSALLGLGLSAFYWLPALAERSYAWIEATMVGKATIPTGHLSSLAELIQPYLAFDYWGPLRFHLALWAAILGGIAIVGILFQARRLQYSLAFMAGVVIAILCLQLTICKPFWEDVPLVRFVQFPWRLLGLASFFLALLIGSILCWKRLSQSAGWIMLMLLAVGIVAASMYNLSPAKSEYWYSFSSSEVSQTDLYERGQLGFPVFTDYMPVWMTEQFTKITASRPADVARLPKLATIPNIRVVEEQPSRIELFVQAELPFTLRLHKFYFPGWQIYLDGRPVPTAASGSLGLVTAELPAGEYSILARFGETPLRRMAIGWSVATLLVWIVGNALDRRGRWMILATTLAVVLFVAMGFIRHGLNELPRQPVACHANFQNEIQLLGYHTDQTSLHAGDTLSLRFYWLAQETPFQDYKVFLHLAKQDDSGLVAQGDGTPIMGYCPTTRWEPGELIVDEHQMQLDDDIPSGTYLLLMGLYREDEMRNLPIIQAPQTLPGDRVVLTPIEVE